MPLYEYECTSCGLNFERRQRMSDDPIQVCPECDGQVRRVFHSVGVIFKGSGFYVTDNRRTSAGSSRTGKTTDHTGKDSDQPSSNGKDHTAESSTAESSKEEKAPSKK